MCQIVGTQHMQLCILVENNAYNKYYLSFIYPSRTRTANIAPSNALCAIFEYYANEKGGSNVRAFGVGKPRVAAVQTFTHNHTRAPQFKQNQQQHGRFSALLEFVRHQARILQCKQRITFPCTCFCAVQNAVCALHI